MIFKVEYLSLGLAHEEGPGPVATDEGVVRPVGIPLLLVHLDHILQLTEPGQVEIGGLTDDDPLPGQVEIGGIHVILLTLYLGKWWMTL